MTAAKSYLGYGWQPIPVPSRQKRPVLRGWQNLRVTEKTLDRYFGAAESNIGILLGKPSGNLVDIDLDCEEARALAGAFLPPTGAIFGRRGNPASHRLYRMERPISTVKYEDTDGSMLLELRSTGMQTVFPPSIHESGEPILWVKSRKPDECGASHLKSCAGRLAAASLLARHWPKGSRQEAALALAGGLLRAGWAEEKVKEFIRAVARRAGDEETAKRCAAVIATADRLRRKETVSGWPRFCGLVGEREVQKVLGWLEIGKPRSAHRQDQPVPDALYAPVDVLHTQPKPNASADRAPASRKLLDLAAGAALFHTPEQHTYAVIPVNSHRRVWPLKSREITFWLQRRFYEMEGRPSGSQPYQEALDVLEARALYDSPQEPVFTRIAWHNGSLYLDLADDEWRAVEVTARGWQVVQNPPVRFRRNGAMLPLPVPAKGGSLAEFLGLINAPDEEIWRLIAAWLVGALHPTGPYPILIVQGEQGSAKSTTVRMLRQLIDPSIAPLRSAPREERDLVISAGNCWVLAYDNLSYLQPWLSDALCRLSTGGGFATRELYTDGSEVVFHALRPVILNGIEDLATRSDLADRSLVVVLPPIADSGRRTKDEMDALFRRAHPYMLGALLDAGSAALRNRDSVRPVFLPRMADFALWVMAAEEALPWESDGFLAVYENNRRESLTVSLESDPVAVAIQNLLAVRGPDYEASATELLQALEPYVSDSVRKSGAWPRSARSLSGRLRRIAPLLRSAGMEPTFGRNQKGRCIRFQLAGEKSVRCVQSVHEVLSFPDEQLPGPCLESRKTGQAPWIFGAANGEAAIGQGRLMQRRATRLPTGCLTGDSMPLPSLRLPRRRGRWFH